MNIEHELQRALGRKPPPPDLAERVGARLQGPQPATPSTAGRRGARTLRWLAAAAVLLLTAAGGARYYEYRQAAAEALRAQAEIRLALEITTDALARVQRKLEETNK